MTSYNPFKEFDLVKMISTTEVTPGLFIEIGTMGVVIDITTPDYYLVRFEKYGAYWVDGKYLLKHNI